MTTRRRLSELAVSETGFVFDPFSGQSFSINASGRVLLDALKRGEPPSKLGALLAAEFELAPGDDAERDVREFLMLLRDFGLWTDDEGGEPWRAR